MKIVLTRTVKDNEELKRDLQEALRGWGGSFYKLSLIEHTALPLDMIAEEICDFSNIIITSRHAARLVSDQLQGKSCYVVGSKTAQLLRSKGANVKYLAINIGDLLAHLQKVHLQKVDSKKVDSKKVDSKKVDSKKVDLQKSFPEDSNIDFLFLSGDHITAAMPPFVERKIIYKTRYKKALSAAEIDVLAQSDCVIPVYSSNCAKTLINIIDSAGLVKNLEKLQTIAISLKVGNILRNVFANVIVADSPEMVTQKIVEYVERRRSEN